MKRHHPLLMLILAFALSFLFATVWVVVLNLILPSTDGAYGQILLAAPFVFTIMSMFASVAAIITYAPLYFVLRDRPFPKAPAILAGIVLAEIVIVTPFLPILGSFGSFAAYAVGLSVVYNATAPMRLEGCCLACGYDLRGSKGSATCPECGEAIKESHTQQKQGYWLGRGISF